jgi:hypothetical protein
MPSSRPRSTMLTRPPSSNKNELRQGTLSAMDDFGGTPAAKLPLDEDGTAAIFRLGRWLRIVGTIQIAIAGMVLLIFGLSALGTAMLAGFLGLLIMLIPLVGFGVWMLQGLRTQAAGEQLKSLAEGHEIDYLELAFVRLKTVFIIEIVVGVLFALGGGVSS